MRREVKLISDGGVVFERLADGMIRISQREHTPRNETIEREIFVSVADLREAAADMTLCQGIHVTQRNDE